MTFIYLFTTLLIYDRLCIVTICIQITNKVHTSNSLCMVFLLIKSDDAPTYRGIAKKYL